MGNVQEKDSSHSRPDTGPKGEANSTSDLDVFAKISPNNLDESEKFIKAHPGIINKENLRLLDERCRDALQKRNFDSALRNASQAAEIAFCMHHGVEKMSRPYREILEKDLKTVEERVEAERKKLEVADKDKHERAATTNSLLYSVGMWVSEDLLQQ